MKKTVMLKATIGWCALCAIWMTYIVSIDLSALMHSGDSGGYGIFVDRRLLIMVSAMPFELASTAALMASGRKASVMIEIVGAVAYCLITIGLWRDSKAIRVVTTGFFATGTLLIGFYLGYIVPSFWTAWGAALGVFAVGTAVLFLTVNGWIAIYFLRPMMRRPVPLGE